MMTLDEAIQHCKEKMCENTVCAQEHKQLAEWLMELKELRKLENHKHIIIEDYKAKFEKLIQRIDDLIAWLESLKEWKENKI